MSRLNVTNFSKRTGSPFQKGKVLPTVGTANKNKQTNGRKIVHEEVLQKSNIVRQKSSMQKSKESLADANKHVQEIEIVDTGRQASPIQNECKESPPIAAQQSTPDVTKNVHEEIVVHKTNFEIQKEKQNELIQIVNKKTAEYQSNKPSSGVFTEVVTHGAFTSKSVNRTVKESTPPKTNGTNGSNGSSSKSLFGFPSSANDLALDAKSDLESDANISKVVKEKVIEKLFALVSMVQHTYESKVRIMTEFEKFKDTHMKNEIRREKEHSEQLYKLNMNFQNEVVQAIQRLKSELDISRNVTKEVEDNNTNLSLKDTSVDFNTSEDIPGPDSNEKSNDQGLPESYLEVVEDDANEDD